MNNAPTAPVVELAQALADPLRLALLQALMAGPATVSELMAETGASQSNVSNHLAVLRERGLVRATRQGRQRVYEPRDAAVGRLIEDLALVAGVGTSLARRGERKSVPLAQARTCYDHLAGKLGVALYDALVSRAAIVPQTTAVPGPVALGPAAEAVFGALGVELAPARGARRHFAASCLDWTERRPHLSGALGAAIWSCALEQGWVQRQMGTRAIIVTDVGRRVFHQQLGILLDEGGARGEGRRA